VRTLLRTDSSVLGNLMQHVDFLKGLDQKLVVFLGPTLNQHCTVANYANNTLVLYTDTPSWASRIRYNTPQILQFLQTECNLVSLKTIRIKVKPVSVQAAQIPDKRLKLDVHTANLIRQSASSVSDDALKCLLLKISKYTQDHP
ncbi:MAG: DciA family protein, partial [Gammaproteobacteria bacterium]